jgi:hypothetical protein
MVACGLLRWSEVYDGSLLILSMHVLEVGFWRV